MAGVLGDSVYQASFEGKGCNWAGRLLRGQQLKQDLPVVVVVREEAYAFLELA